MHHGSIQLILNTTYEILSTKLPTPLRRVAIRVLRRLVAVLRKLEPTRRARGAMCGLWVVRVTRATSGMRVIRVGRVRLSVLLRRSRLLELFGVSGLRGPQGRWVAGATQATRARWGCKVTRVMRLVQINSAYTGIWVTNVSGALEARSDTILPRRRNYVMV